MATPAQDERWMRRALDLARRGEGLTRPNPPVGAVLVKNGRMVGEGWHRRAGGPHAEVHALRRAGDRAAGATLYVTLEPCSTWGRTPPCTEAILGAGVSRVVVGTTDPNPRHAGRGLRLLARRGLVVVTSVCRDEAVALLEPFTRHVLEHRPFLTLKLGQTLDGRIADTRGTSKWITSPASRKRVQALRRRVDAIMVGAETVRRDDPVLLPRPAAGRRPLRVVVSASGRLPPRARVLTDDRAADTVVAIPRSLERDCSYGEAVTLRVRNRGARVSLRALLRDLARRGVLHVLCEGGGDLAAALVREGLVDELLMVVAPHVLGGRARPSVGGEGWRLAAAPRFVISRVDRVGPDVWITSRRT